MSVRWFVCELTVAGALVACAHGLNDYGGAPLVNNAESHIDQRVTVVGEVDEVRGEQTFTLTRSDLAAADERLLVIAEQPVRQITMGDATVFRGERLQVYGMVRRLNASDAERTYGFNLDPDWVVMYDNRPVVVTHWISPPK